MTDNGVKRMDSSIYTESRVGSPPPLAKKSFTFSSAVSNSHARTLAYVEATSPDTPKEVFNAYVYLIAVIVCLGAATSYGYDTGFFGGTLALPSFKDEFGLNSISKEERDVLSSNMVSLFQGGSFFGAILQLPITNRLGRKYSLMISNIIFIISGLMQVFSYGSVPLMSAARFIGGFAIGVSSLVAPVYLSEFAPPPIRGRLVGFFDMFLQVGTLLGFWVNYIMDRTVEASRFQWQMPVAIQLFPAAILLVTIFFVPETPRYLLSRQRVEQAERNLMRLRKLPLDHPYLQWELAQTRQQVESERMVLGNANTRTLLLQLLRHRGHRNRVMLGMGLIFFKTFSGVQAVNYYSPRIFEQLGFVGATNSLFATGLYGTVKFVCTVIFGLFIVDRVGRRRPLMVGSVVGSLCLFYLGGYLTAVGPRDGGSARTAGDYTVIVALFLYAAIYCFGYNSVPLTLVSEIFTLRYRTVSMSIVLAWQWLCTFAVVRIMPVALTNIGSRTYFIFGSIFFCATFFVFFLIPETKGLPLEAMDRLFGGVERSDLEAAVIAVDSEKADTQHIEYSHSARGTQGEAGAVANPTALAAIAEK